MKISGGLIEHGIPVGNVYDKYGSKNVIVRWFLRGFENALDELVVQADPKTIHEIGCGEGYWVLRWVKSGRAARGSDFSQLVIDLARSNAQEAGLSPDLFQLSNVYEPDRELGPADLVVCCELLEHLQDPERALKSLQAIVCGSLIISVPREPLWSALNIARGKYLAAFGNTPGHLQRWTSKQCVELVGKYFEIVSIRKPLPWTMLLCRPKHA